MKQARFMMIAAAMIGAAVFTGCKKETMPLDTAGIAASAKTEPGTTASVAYYVDIPPQRPDAKLVWQQGSLSVAALLLDGAYDNGKNTIPVAVSAQPTQLMYPLFSQGSVGAVTIKTGVYQSLLFRMRLSRQGAHSLDLTGNYDMNGRPTTVHLVVDDDLLLQAKTPGPLKLTFNTPYSARLLWDLNYITEIIAPDVMTNAKVDYPDPQNPDHGVINVSATSNFDLYNRILQAIREHPLTVKFY